jgi:hypothetical protein
MRGTAGNGVFYGGPCRGVISGTKFRVQFRLHKKQTHLLVREDVT